MAWLLLIVVVILWDSYNASSHANIGDVAVELLNLTVLFFPLFTKCYFLT